MRKPSRGPRKTDASDPGKALCQKYHSMGRAMSRFGFKLTPELYDQIVACIKKQKEHPQFSLKYKESQSNRLDVYEITVPEKEPFQFIFDKIRGSIVTFLYPEDKQNIYHYYDIFNNKVSVKHVFGKIWKLKDEILEIPGETVEYKNGIWEVIEGVLSGKRFKLDQQELVEVM